MSHLLIPAGVKLLAMETLLRVISIVLVLETARGMKKMQKLHKIAFCYNIQSQVGNGNMFKRYTRKVVL